MRQLVHSLSGGNNLGPFHLWWTEIVLIVWELQWGYPQKMMEKFSPTLFSQFLGVDFENSTYTGQICMEHPYFGLQITWFGPKSPKILVSLIQKWCVLFDTSFDSEQKIILRLFMKVNISKVTGGLNLTIQGVKFRKNTI